MSSNFITKTGSFTSFAALLSTNYSEFENAGLPADDGVDLRSVSPFSSSLMSARTPSPVNITDFRSPSPACHNDCEEPTAAELASILQAITLSPSQDLGTDTFHSVNQTISADIAARYFAASRGKLTLIINDGEDLLHRYIDAGSFYSALIPALAKKDYVGVYICIEVLSDFDLSLLTPRIELCKAACLNALNRQDEISTSLFKSCLFHPNLDSTLNEILLENADLKGFYEPLVKFFPSH